MPGPFAGLSVWAGLFASASAQALLVFAPLSVWRDGTGPLRAIRSAVREGASRFWPVVLLLLTVMLVHRPIEYLIAQPDRVVMKFRPELIFYVLIGGIVVEVITSFFLFAATTGLAASRREDPFI